MSRSTITNAIPPPTSATPTITTAATVIRKRTVPDPDRRRAREAEVSATVGVEPVSRPAARLDRVPAERAVELVAEVAHVDLDDVRVAFEVVVPHVVEDLALRHDIAASPQQEFEERDLAGGEVDLGVAAPRPLGGGVEAEVAGLEDRGPFTRAAAEQRAQPGDEDRRGRRAW